MNNYFMNITKTLNLETLNISQIDIGKFENHISMKKVLKTFPKIIPGIFHFEQVSSDIIRKEIRSLNAEKSPTQGSINASILKQCIDAYLPYLTVTIHYSLKENTFLPKSLNVLRRFHYTRNWTHQKENYRPVSLLPHVSKFFQKNIYKQINTYMENKLPKCLTDFRNLREPNICL